MIPSRICVMSSVLQEVCLTSVAKRCPNCSKAVALLSGLMGMCDKCVTISTPKCSVFFRSSAPAHRLKQVRGESREFPQVFLRDQFHRRSVTHQPVCSSLLGERAKLPLCGL